jgi:hypothetical protein
MPQNCGESEKNDSAAAQQFTSCIFTLREDIRQFRIDSRTGGARFAQKETQGKSDAGEVTDRKTESTVSQQRDMHGGNTKSFL